MEAVKRPCRVVCSTDSPDWLQHRKLLVTGSKALESGVGLLVPEDHPFRAGKARPFREGDADPAALWFGQEKEPMVGRALRRFAHLRVHPFRYLLGSTELEGLGASYDFLAAWPLSGARRLAVEMNLEWVPWSCPERPAPGEVVPVEVKCRSIDPGWNKSWKHRLPKKAAWQGQCQMAVLGARFVLWAIHFDHAEIRLGLQKRDEVMVQALTDVAGGSKL